MIRQECDIVDLLPWKTLGTVEIQHRRTDSISTVGFRQGRGAGFGGVSGHSTDHVADAVWHLGAAVKADKTDLRDKLAGDIIGDRIKNAVTGMRYTVLDYFINGDHGTNPYGFEGIKTRLANMSTSQIVYGETSSAALDIRSAANPSESDLYQFMDSIDEAIDQLDGSTGDIALTSSDFIAAARSAFRRMGKWTMHPDSEAGKFGTVGRRTSADKPTKPVLVYPEERPIKWYDMGFKADQTTRVVGTETVGGVATRPVYFVKIGHPYVYGIQQYGIETSEPMKLPDGVTTQVTIDWPMGLHHVHNRSISKLAGVRVA